MNRACAVTGAASGIGAALADRLLADGARVLALDLRLEALERRARAGAWPADRALLRALDVRDAPGWEAALEEGGNAFGRLDVLFNIAGALKPGLILDFAPEDAALHLDVNAKGVILGTRAAARRMAASGGGHIVNMASMAALAPVPGISLYTASKFAVRGFSLAAAQELAPLGIAVTLVCPDAVATPMLDLQKSYKEAALTFSGSRFQSAEEVAAALAGPVLERRPIELAFPASRAWLARLANLFPAIAFAVGPALARKGLKRQAELQGAKP